MRTDFESFSSEITVAFDMTMCRKRCLQHLTQHSLGGIFPLWDLPSHQTGELLWLVVMKKGINCALFIHTYFDRWGVRWLLARKKMTLKCSCFTPPCYAFYRKNTVKCIWNWEIFKRGGGVTINCDLLTWLFCDPLSCQISFSDSKHGAVC